MLAPLWLVRLSLLGSLLRDCLLRITVRLGLSRSVAKDMAHVPISGETGSLQKLSKLPGRKIYTHINNTNPILDPDSAERRAVESAGWEIAYDGMEISVEAHEEKGEKSE